MNHQTKTSIFSFLFAFAAAFTVANHFVSKSWNGIVYFHVGSERNPAAISSVFDYSNLKGQALAKATRQRVVADAKLLLHKNQIGLELGHFVTKNQFGKKDLACNTYNKVTLTFHAVDSATNGAPSQLFVTSDCYVGGDINKISAIWIPYKKIISQPPSDFEIEFFGERHVKIRFENMDNLWPAQWELYSVQLFNDEYSRQEMLIKKEEIRRFRKKPIVMNW